MEVMLKGHLFSLSPRMGWPASRRQSLLEEVIYSNGFCLSWETQRFQKIWKGNKICFNHNNQAGNAKYKLESLEAGKLIKKLLQQLSQQEPKLDQWPVEE